MKVDPPLLWEPGRGLSETAPGKAASWEGAWADRGRAVEEGELVHKQRSHQHRGWSRGQKVGWKGRRVQTLSVWYAPRWGEVLSPV